MILLLLFVCKYMHVHILFISGLPETSLDSKPLDVNLFMALQKGEYVHQDEDV